MLAWSSLSEFGPLRHVRDDAACRTAITTCVCVWPGACTGTKAVDELMVEAAHFWGEGVLNGGQPLELLGCEASPTAVPVNTELFLAESGVPVCSRAGREASASTSDGGSWVSVRSSRSHRNSRSGSFWWQGEAKPQAAFARRGFSGDPFALAAG